MNAVVYYSGSGQSERIACQIAKDINFNCINLLKTAKNEFDNLVLVFPIYCQNIPNTVKDFLKVVKCEKLSLIATYGKISCGNALWEIQRDFNFNVIAGAYIPTAHSYIENDVVFSDFSSLQVLYKNILIGNEKVVFPKLKKNIFANFCKDARSRFNLKIIRNNNCNFCGECNKSCPNNAIYMGKTNKNCIRCLKCVTICKNNALTYKKGELLKAYLKKKKVNDLLIYV